MKDIKGIFKIKIIWITLIANNLYLYSTKIHPDAGSTSAQFLKIPVGAYYSSLGGSVINIREDILSSFYNPSFIANYKNKIFNISHNFHISDINQSYIAFGNKVNNLFNTKGYFVISLNWLNIADLEKRSGLYESSSYDPSPIEERFKANDFSIMFSYGFEYKDVVNSGFSIKYISQKIDNLYSATIAFDIGVNKEILIKDKNYNIDFAINNIGRGIKFETKRYKLPLLFRVGGWSDFWDLKVSFNILKYIDNYPYFILGFSKDINSYLDIRAGYRYRFYGNELGFWSGVSFGIGFSYNKFRFDYSLNPYGELGYSHKVSLNFKY